MRGKIYNEDFKFARGRIFKLISYVIELKDGKDFLPDKELTVFIFGSEDEVIPGSRYVFPDAKRKQQPKLVLIWNTSNGERKQKEIERGYSMTLEFGQIEDDRLDGRINVALPNRNDLSLSGKFVLDVEY